MNAKLEARDRRDQRPLRMPASRRQASPWRLRGHRGQETSQPMAAPYAFLISPNRAAPSRKGLGTCPRASLGLYSALPATLPAPSSETREAEGRKVERGSARNDPFRKLFAYRRPEREAMTAETRRDEQAGYGSAADR